MIYSINDWSNLGFMALSINSYNWMVLLTALSINGYNWMVSLIAYATVIGAWYLDRCFIFRTWIRSNGNICGTLNSSGSGRSFRLNVMDTISY